MELPSEMQRLLNCPFGGSSMIDSTVDCGVTHIECCAIYCYCCSSFLVGLDFLEEAVG